MSARAVKTFGDRASELLSTMVLNMRQPETPKFIASVSDAAVATAILPLFQKELSTRAADFLADVEDSLKRKPAAKSSKPRSKSARVSVTIFYHESVEAVDATAPAAIKRRYFRREK